MIIDAHAHLGDVSAFMVPDISLEAMLSLMDHVGIDLSVQSHAAGLMECFEEAYKASEAAYEQSGARLPYYLTYHPRYAEDSLVWINKALERPGFVGVKIHPGQHQTFPEAPAYQQVWELAAEQGFPLLTHSWVVSDYNPTQRFATVEHYEHCVKRFPQVNLILGHAGGRYEGHLATAHLVQKHPNVYVDISGDVYAFRFIEWLVGQIGAERILFGSDLNWIDPRTTIGRVLDADISLEEKRLILGENARQLLRLGD